MNKITFSTLLLATIILFSCETKVDINADYKDITVVYGAIDPNPNDTTHYIKVNRAFLQDGVSATELAGNSDNFNYPADEISVTVQEISSVSGNVVNTYNLTRTIKEVPKNPGIFANDVNVLFKFTATINRNNLYKLKIYNNKLDKEITSETKIVGTNTVTVPTLNQKIAFWNGDVVSGDYLSRSISFTTGKNIGRVEARLVFNYTDYFTPASGLDSIPRRIVMPLGEKKTINSSTGNEVLEWTMEGATFFSNVTANTPTTLDFLSHREIGNVSMEFIVTGTELNIFMEVNEPSNNVNQEKPAYTNINNGLGVFSSRETYNWISTVDPQTGNINLTAPTILKLKSLGLSYCFGNSALSGHQCP